MQENERTCTKPGLCSIVAYAVLELLPYKFGSRLCDEVVQMEKHVYEQKHV